MRDKALRVRNYTYSLEFFLKLFAAFLFLCLFKIFFQFFALFCALVGKVGLARHAADRALELYGLPFKVKGELFGKDFVALAANKRSLDVVLAELVRLHPEGGVCQVIFFAYV